MVTARTKPLALALLIVAALAGGAQAQQGPDAALKAVMDGLADYKLEVVWDALPGSYQGDVQGLVSGFADKMDAELWTKSFSVLKKLVLVLQTKKQFILNFPMLAQMPPNKKQILADNWDGIVQLASTVVNSDVSDLQKLRAIDIRTFLATTGSSIMRQAVALGQAANPQDDPAGKVASLRQATVTVVRTEGPDRAVLRMQVPNETAEEKVFVKVEGKWLPENMVMGWQAGILQAKQKLAAIEQQKIAAAKAQVMPILTMIEGSLDQLAAANTPEQFNALAMGLGGMLMGMAGQMQGGGPGPRPAPPVGVAPAPAPAAP